MSYRFTFTILIYIFSFSFFIHASFGFISSITPNSPPNLGQTINTSVFFTFSAISKEYKENTTELKVNNETLGIHFLYIGNKTDDFPVITIIVVNDSAENGILNISINGELAKSIQIPSTSTTVTISDKNLLANQINNFTYSTNTSGFVNITLVNVTYILATPFNCSLFIDDIPKVNKTVTSNQETTVLTNLTNGDHSWYVSCVDKETQRNSSARIIGIGSNVSRCAIFLDENATYYLTQSVSSSDTCFRFLKKNSTLDCMYNGILGSGSSEGIFANKNFTKIYNCKISNWDTCIYLSNSYYLEIENISCRSANRGVWFYGIYNSTLYNLTAVNEGDIGIDGIVCSSPYGCFNNDIQLVNISNFDENIVVYEGSNNYFRDVYTSYGRRGIRIESSNNFMENVNVEKAEETGILIVSSYNVLKNIKVRECGQYGILVTTTTIIKIEGIKLENIIASFNGVDGIRIGKTPLPISRDSPVNSVYLENITTQWNGHSGIFFSSSSNLTVKNAYLEENRICLGIGKNYKYSKSMNITSINVTCKHSFPLLMVNDNTSFLNSNLVMIRRPNITYENSKVIVNFTFTYPNGTPCNNLTINSINLYPQEGFSYSINRSLLEINFTKKRSGYYAVVVNTTDDKNNSVLWYLPEWNLSTFQYYFRSPDPYWWPSSSEYDDVGCFDFTPPPSDEAVSCGTWVQFSFNKLPFPSFHSSFVVEAASFKSYYKSDDTSWFGIEENVSYSAIVNKFISVPPSSGYTAKKVEFFNLYIPITSPKDFYFLTFKLVGDYPSIFSNATNLSTANISVSAPSSLFVKNITKNIWVLSESYQTYPFNLKIYIDGVGTENITISLPNNETYEVKYDGLKCESTPRCNLTQIDDVLLLSLKLGSLHEIEISQITNSPYFQNISIIPNSTIYSPNITITTNATVCDVDKDLKEVKLEVLGKNNTMANISQINENCTLFSLNLTGLPAGNITLKYYAIDEVSNTNETERVVEIKKANSSIITNITACTQTFTNENVTSYEGCSIKINSCISIPSWQVNSSTFILFINSYERGNLTGNCIYYEFNPTVGEYKINTSFTGNQNYTSNSLVLWLKVISQPSQPTGTGGGGSSIIITSEKSMENETEEKTVKNLTKNKTEESSSMQNLIEELGKIFGKINRLSVIENKSFVNFENKNPELEMKINSTSFSNLTQIQTNVSFIVTKAWIGNNSFYLTKIQKTTKYPEVVEILLVPNTSLIVFFKGNYTLLAEDPVYKITTENGEYGYYIKTRFLLNHTGAFISSEKEEISKVEHKIPEALFVSIVLIVVLITLLLSKRLKKLR